MVFEESAQWVETYSIICDQCVEENEIPQYALRCFYNDGDTCGIAGCKNKAHYEVHLEMLEDCGDGWS